MCPLTMSYNRSRSEVTIARRYLDHGFLDVALRMFSRNVEHVRSDDWTRLVTRLVEAGRVPEAIETCRLGGVPMPRRELLALGDRRLRCKDVDAAIHYYELAEASHERWSAVVDVLTRLPARELQAIAVTERHLVASLQPMRVAASA
jgi:hypothetical protein